MNGIASFLDEAATARVQLIWRELETSCGLAGVKATPFPHFSWQVTDGYDLPRLESILRVLARQAQPFKVCTAGLGIFTSNNPIVYIPLIKDEVLMHFHLLLWEQTNGIAIHPSLYYAPDQWVPHITLAINDVNRHNLDCAMQYLAYQSFDWEMQIDNFVFIVQVEDKASETFRYRFGI